MVASRPQCQGSSINGPASRGSPLTPLPARPAEVCQKLQKEFLTTPTPLYMGLGLARNTDLDIVRNPLLSKAPYLARGIVHKVFALSTDKVLNDRNALSLFKELPRRRLEIRFGKFSMVDFFDQNSVGSDTHFQFTNWTVDNNGAYDYAADTRGYTVGVTADYEDRNWGLRFAEALMPKVANGIDLVWKPWQAHAESFEYEL